MLVISRTPRVREHGSTVCLTHTDVLLLLVCALAFASFCCFRIATGTVTLSGLFFFVLQAIFCMLVCPTLSIALRLAPSTFLTQYVRGRGASWLLKGIAGAMLTQTLAVFWYLL